MTMLALEENPPLLSRKTLDQCRGTWWIAQTKPRFEKALAWDMLRRGIDYFLPLMKRVRVARGRKYRVMVPLFPSYVFFCGSAEDRLGVFETRRIWQTLDVLDQSGLVCELEAIHFALASGVPLEPCPLAQEGRRCRITAGPFQGFEGTVVQVRGQARLLLEVRTLGQAACLEIERDLLEPVTDGRPGQG